MLAMPVASFSWEVADSSSAAVTKGSRPTVSGIHNVGNPRSSSTAAARCASFDETASSTPVQIPTRPRSIVVFPIPGNLRAPVPTPPALGEFAPPWRAEPAQRSLHRRLAVRGQWGWTTASTTNVFR